MLPHVGESLKPCCPTGKGALERVKGIEPSYSAWEAYTSDAENRRKTPEILAFSQGTLTDFTMCFTIASKSMARGGRTLPMGIALGSSQSNEATQAAFASNFGEVLERVRGIEPL
jgi:hypothetical protein